MTNRTPLRAPAGERRLFRFPVLTDLDGSELAIHAHAVTGAADGPTLTLLSGVHGNEWFSHAVLRAVLAGTDPATLRGTLVVVPAANPYALRTVTRYSNDIQQVGFVNLNKAILRDTESITGRTGRVLVEQIVERSTHLLDFHPGPWGSTWGVVLYDATGPLSTASRELAVAFGMPYIQGEDAAVVFPNSVFDAATAAGVPSIGVEVGGLGFGFRSEDEWVARNVDGVRRVMASLGMLDEPVTSRSVTDVEVAWDLRPTYGGMLVPEITEERLLTATTEGELLGRLLSPVDLTVLEEYRSPGDGILLSVPRSHPVHPHNFGFVIGRTRRSTS
ncbi:succinylglutamate desuccinylase/aspartoacylase family protein [Micromonospora sp. NBC_01638]|uniref:succinylglutamate desuccinylase/aspartoacylase family protein n=1 Tax=Micromonospora sp. NBC_01638 TaxID=2975982 RepID=UPI00386D1836|nr:succinylglutamate desuccinylase/aspartoacylase family protein [Micromonospora sp. NBC_01638]